jgi:multicomponent K+:H+ antiporter subunit D
LLYVLGVWHQPFGIALLADRLSAMMVALTAVLAFAAALYASAHEENTGRFFYPLFMFQIMGINGAFLTGDIFNLFVFFEVLLIASYALLIHGGGKEKTKVSFQYVTLNLLGSAFFLFALGTLYGTLGTLSMADMSVNIALLLPQEQSIAKAGGLLLLLVFGLKSAMLPLQFWLPRTYAAASAPVAALFAIMTKVGLYSIFRVFGGIFGEEAGALAHMASSWIWPLAIATIAFGTLSALAAPTLRLLTAAMVIVSVGTLLMVFVVNNGQSLAAGLNYMNHSTLIIGALFLISDQIRVQS